MVAVLSSFGLGLLPNHAIQVSMRVLEAGGGIGLHRPW